MTRRYITLEAIKLLPDDPADPSATQSVIPAGLELCEVHGFSVGDRYVALAFDGAVWSVPLDKVRKLPDVPPPVSKTPSLLRSTHYVQGVGDLDGGNKAYDDLRLHLAKAYDAGTGHAPYQAAEFVLRDEYMESMLPAAHVLAAKVYSGIAIMNAMRRPSSPPPFSSSPSRGA